MRIDLSVYFDAVVMLTMSDWFTEPISNRYHFASRFEKQLKVYFVQPDLTGGGCSVENTEFDNIKVVHICRITSLYQYQQLEYFLLKSGVTKPLWWVYNYRFANFIKRVTGIKIFHATEDFLNFPQKDVEKYKDDLITLIKNTDLLVAVSENVEKSYRTLGIDFKCIVLKNGVDYKKWRLKESEKKNRENNHDKIIIYQGNVNYRLDYSLLSEIADEMHDWEIWLCGRNDGSSEFKKLVSDYSNVRYYGEMDIDSVRNKCIASAVGIIPFKQNELMKNSIPLKTFEYMAAGLSVASIPIDGLRGKKPYIRFASDGKRFCKIIKELSLQNTADDIIRKDEIAREEDYDARFLRLINELAKICETKIEETDKNVAILYDESSNKIFTIKNYLDMFERYSANRVKYIGIHEEIDNLLSYDAVIVFYSVRVCERGFLPEKTERGIKSFTGKKLLFIQDDYDNTEETRKFIKRNRIDAVLSVVPYSYINKAYPLKRFRNTFFFSILTGYISDEMKEYTSMPIASRDIHIGYRGRELGWWYGNLGREKLMIGAGVKKRVKQYDDIKEDVEWDDAHRIGAEGWLDWLSSLKTTLATQSGSNIFDEKQLIKRNVLRIQRFFPSITYEHVHKLLMSRVEGRIKTETVSPKMFEAIALKTVLIMFEGNYSDGLLKPNIHFIPLKKDFSNFEQVVEKVRDDAFLQSFADNAYNDIMGRYELTYKWLIGYADRILASSFPLDSKVVNRDRRHAEMKDFVERLDNKIKRTLIKKGSSNG